MSEKHNLQRFAWLTEPLPAEENRALLKSVVILLLSSVLFGFIPILLGELINVPLVSWVGKGSLLFGCFWTVMFFLPLFISTVRRARERAREK
ncbi:MAG: hypothetical protein ABI456_23065 [Ktedonobacteraceae bacterium]